MAVKEKQVDSAEEIEWNVENEIQLFFAMNGHKPVGECVFLCDRVSNALRLC